MNAKKMSLLLFIFLLICTACTVRQNDSPQNPPSKGNATQSESQGSTNAIALYEKLEIQDYDDLTILDIYEDMMLLNAFIYYRTDNPKYSELGYNSQTVNLVLYDWKNETMLAAYDVPEDHMCVDGFLWGDGSFVYVTIHEKADAEYVPYEIISHEGDGERTLLSGACIVTGYSEPQIDRLDEQSFVLAYYEPDTKQFGIDVFNRTGDFAHQIALTDDGKTEYLYQELICGSKQYLYYAAVGGVGRVYVGTSNGVSSFDLSATEQVYNYTFLTDDMILFCMEVTDESGAASKCLVVKNPAGETLFLLDIGVYYRLASDGAGTVLCIDGNYQPYSIQLDENEAGLTVRKLTDVDALPSRFYAIGDGTFLVHTYNSSYLHGEAPTAKIVAVK